MDKKFDEILKEGLESVLLEKGIERSKASAAQLGSALTEYYMKQIGQFIYRIPEDVIDESICDGKNDLGIDYASKQDKEWLIVQCKYKGQNSSVTSDEIAGFFAIHSKLNDTAFFEKHANSALKDLLYDYKDDDPVQFLFVTNDKLTARVEDEFNKHQNKITSDDITYELKGLSGIKADFKSVNSETENIIEDVTINVESITDTFLEQDRSAYIDLSSLIDKQHKYKAVICTIRGTTLQTLWQQHRSRIFNYNIRGYLGDNAINKKMRQTLEKEPDKFYFYNNGISAICTELSAEYNENDLKSFKCKNFAIINGAQTTTTIGRFKDVGKLREVRVLLKITKAEDYKKEKGLNKNIITYNNSQTIIKASDFRSNDEIQLFLETNLSAYTYKGHIPHEKVHYLRKRLKVEKKKDNIYIPIETLARVLYTFDHDPILIFQGTKYLFDTDTENNGKYWVVFGEKNEEVDYYSQKRLEKIISVYFLWLRIEIRIKSLSKMLKIENNESIKYQALLAKWHFLWAYGFILNTLHPDQLEALFKKIASGKLFENASETFIEKWFPKVHNTISKCIERNYRDTNKKGKEIQSFNFKNWLRSGSEFEELSREFKYMDKSDFPIS